MEENDKQHGSNFTLSQYLPLVIISLFSLILSASLMKTQQELSYRFMGFFLALFSLFKWIDIKGFMESFKQYDIVSKYLPSYLLIYPILELVLGILYVSLTLLTITNIVTILIMGMNGFSVIVALYQKKNLNCACLGTVLKLPLTFVSLFEIIFMTLMAFLMLYY